MVLGSAALATLGALLEMQVLGDNPVLQKQKPQGGAQQSVSQALWNYLVMLTFENHSVGDLGVLLELRRGERWGQVRAWFFTMAE